MKIIKELIEQNLEIAEYWLTQNISDNKREIWQQLKEEWLLLLSKEG